MPNPCASAGTMYLVSVGSGSLAISESQEPVDQLKTKPPLTGSNWPVTKPAPWPSRNTTGPVTSSGSWARCMARPETKSCRRSSGTYSVGSRRPDQQEAGREGVDGDAVGPQLASQRAGHRDHRALAGNIMKQARRAPQR